LVSSIARGDHTEPSGIDLLVNFDEGVRLCQIARRVADLEQLLEISRLKARRLRASS
jgi:predicted nucleotidyltransferase